MAELHDALATTSSHADFAASPVAARALGLTDYDARLDDLSAEAFAQRDADAAAFLGRLDAIPRRRR